MDMEVGDIILSHDNGFLPSAIRYFMKKYANRIGVKADKYYNHVGVCVEVNGQKRVAEAMAKGVQIIQTPEEYLEHHPDYLIRTWVKPLNGVEKRQFNLCVTELSYKITKYDFLNFRDQVGLVLFNKWKGRRGANALVRVYCSELAGYAMDFVRGSFSGTWYMRNPLDIQIHNHLKDVK